MAMNEQPILAKNSVQKHWESKVVSEWNLGANYL